MHRHLLYSSSCRGQMRRSEESGAQLVHVTAVSPDGPKSVEGVGGDAHDGEEKEEKYAGMNTLASEVLH